MHFITTRQQAIQALALIKTCIPKGFPKTSILLSCVQNSVLLLYADAHFFLAVSLETQEILEEGLCCISFQQLEKGFRGLPKKRVDVSLQGDKGTLTSEGKQIALQLLQADDYPGIREMHLLPGDTYIKEQRRWESGNAWQNGREVITTYTYETLQVRQQQLSLQVKDLLPPLRQTAFVAAEDDSRPVFTTISTELNKNILTLTTADSFRLATVSLPLSESGTWETTLLLPAICSRVIFGLTEQTEIQIEACISTHQLIQQNGHKVRGNRPFERIEVITLTANGLLCCMRPPHCTYPDYRQVIPVHSSTIIECEKEHLEKAAKALLDIAKQDDSRLTFASTATHLTLLATYPSSCMQRQSNQEPKQETIQVEAVVSGPDVQIVLNAHYVLEFLEAITSPRVAIELISDSRPAMLRPLCGDMYRYILMPMSKKQK